MYSALKTRIKDSFKETYTVSGLNGLFSAFPEVFDKGLLNRKIVISRQIHTFTYIYLVHVRITSKTFRILY